ETSDVKALMEKIELVNDTEWNQSLDAEGILGVRLTAELTDGTEEEYSVRHPKGHPEAFLSDAELLEKMTWLLDGIAPANTPERLLDLCRRLSTVDDVKQLVDLCNVPAA
ncbi:MAG: hypothetical protein ACREP5_05515, partial [Candidatus Binatia bacterium]